MSTRYRVTVERIEDVEGAQYETREAVLFEATSPSMERLAAFAPVEVLAALGGVAGSLRLEVGGEQRPMPVNGATLGALVERISSPAEVNREQLRRDEAAEAEAARPKRARRTKAQIAADEAAAQQAAEVVVSNDQAVAQVGEAADTVAEQVVAQQLGYMTPDGPVIAEPTLAAVELADAETGNPSEPPAVAPAAPFNPFLR